MLESIQNENLEYQRLTPEEMKARGILGRLVGVAADFQHPTRNGRLYSEELWEKVFNDPIMKERIQNGVCYGELGHPEDREETDMEKIAVCLSEVPKKGKDGKLRAVFDILDTPNGRILKSLCDYGSTLGISSRGSGDLVTGFNGQEEVDPSSYNCEGFDVVLIPAVKEARLQYVTESLNKTRYNKTLRQKLQESLDKASPEERKVMKEGLDSIGIELFDKDETVSLKEDAVGDMEFFDDINSDVLEDLNVSINENNSLNQSFEDFLNQEFTISYGGKVIGVVKGKDFAKDKTINIDKNTEVDNNESGLLDELKESVSKSNELRNRVVELQEKLSVCYSKEAAQEDKITTLSDNVFKLSKASKQNELLKTRIDTLTEKLNKEKDSSSIKDQSNKKLKESLNSVVEKYNRLVDAHNGLKENYRSINSEYKELEKELEEVKLDNEKLKEEYANKISNSNALVEKYKKAASSAAEKYIDSQAVRIGVSSREIKNKLPEKYTFEDVDSICEELSNYNLSISKLPFSVSRIMNEDVKIEATPSKEPILPEGRFDDEVDDLLKRLSGINTR